MSSRPVRWGHSECAALRKMGWKNLTAGSERSARGNWTIWLTGNAIWSRESPELQQLVGCIGSAIRNDLDVHVYWEHLLQHTLAGDTDWSAMARHIRKRFAPIARTSGVKPPTASEYTAPAGDRKVTVAYHPCSNQLRRSRLATSDSTPKRKWLWCTVTDQRLKSLFRRPG